MDKLIWVLFSDGLLVCKEMDREKQNLLFPAPKFKNITLTSIIKKIPNRSVFFLKLNLKFFALVSSSKS